MNLKSCHLHPHPPPPPPDPYELPPIPLISDSVVHNANITRMGGKMHGFYRTVNIEGYYKSI